MASSPESVNRRLTCVAPCSLGAFFPAVPPAPMWSLSLCISPLGTLGGSIGVVLNEDTHFDASVASVCITSFLSYMCVGVYRMANAKFLAFFLIPRGVSAIVGMRNS